MSKSERATGVVPEVTSLIGRTGLHIRDPIEDVQAVLYTDVSVDPTETSTEEFVYPVDRAVEVSVGRLETPFTTDVWIRDSNGSSVAQHSHLSDSTYIIPGKYLLDVTGMGLKIYIMVDGSAIDIRSDEDSTIINLEETRRIRIGTRSLHSQPARTITTTSDPVDLMGAISLFGTAMKTWSPERTYPSLRGHPPLLDLEKEAKHPPDLQPPETGISLTVPPAHEWVYPAAPTAYWLGATVRPGDPALHLGTDSFPLGIRGGSGMHSERETVEKHLKDIIQYTFLFDCAVRPEGLYQTELDARYRVEEAGLSLDYEALYRAPIAERVKAYLELVPSLEQLEAKLGRPGWRLTADVQPDPERATILPFLARDLAVVRCHDEITLQSMIVEDGDRETYFNSTRGGSDSGIGGALTRAGVRSSAPSSSNQTVELPETSSMAQTWVGDGFALEAAKASTTSYLQRLEKRAEGRSRISIDVVVNDEEMSDERTVSEIYGTRDLLEFDIEVHDQLTVDGLGEVFECETDFIHYIGHVDDQGFECQSGYLSAEQISRFGADSFVLNACESHVQGELLVNKGAIGGVVTLEEVISVMATEVGETIARLVNLGFPIGAATSIVQETMLSGSNYVAVGDTTASLVQSNTDLPFVAHVGLRNDDRFNLSIGAFASLNYDIGTHYQPHLESCDRYYVIPGELDTWSVTAAELDAFLNRSTFPVVAASKLYWSDQTTTATLREMLENS